METLSFVIALSAIAAVTLLWFYLRRVNENVEKLKRMHAPNSARKLAELTLPFFNVENRPQEGQEKSGTKRPATSSERLIILGYGLETIVIDNQSSGTAQAVKEITIEIPEGTTDVLASIRGFLLAFGKITANPDNVDFTINHGDHHLGLEFADIEVVKVGRVTARLRAHMLLKDWNGDDSWVGILGVTLLFLGPHP